MSKVTNPQTQIPIGKVFLLLFVHKKKPFCFASLTVCMDPPTCNASFRHCRRTATMIKPIILSANLEAISP